MCYAVIAGLAWKSQLATSDSLAGAGAHLFWKCLLHEQLVPQSTGTIV